MTDSIVIADKTVTVHGETFLIPEKWRDKNNQAKIKRIIITDKTADPYWDREQDMPVGIFTKLSSVKNFIEKHEIQNNVRVFVIDRIYQNNNWYWIPVKELFLNNRRVN